MGRFLWDQALNGSLPAGRGPWRVGSRRRRDLWRGQGPGWGGDYGGLGALPLTGRGSGEGTISETPGSPPGSCWQEQHNQQLQEQWEELSSQVHAADSLFLLLRSPILVPAPGSARPFPGYPLLLEAP